MVNDAVNRVITVRAAQLRPRRWFDRLARRFPFAGLFGAILISNVAGSFFNFFYNKLLIVERLSLPQVDAFWNVAAPLYNLAAYPLCFTILWLILRPMRQFMVQLR